LNASDVTLREGQWEAIRALVEERKKLLVVQRTGWGKSSVYFISTRLLRERGYGPTVIISPLLALMRNQLDAANRLGVSAVTLNSANKAAWEDIAQQIASNTIDCLLISPERLSNEDFYNDLLMPIAELIGLMVVDEYACFGYYGYGKRPCHRRYYLSAR
jgi:ATP-dependent DNA helicase RecQ